MHTYGYIYKELPIEQIERDINQPRRDFGTNGDENHLLVSIRNYGIEEPLKVSEVEPGRYLLIDGHRRFNCAKKIGMAQLPCRIYPKMSPGELETRRYEMQNNRRPWKPMERSEALERIKIGNNFRTNREVADLLGMTETMVNNSLILRKQRIDHVEKMERYGLSESCRIEFVRLHPKLRKVKDIEVDEVVYMLFEKISNQVIKNVRDFRVLGKLFLRASANEEELHRFFTNADMTIPELEHRTSEVGFSLLLEETIQSIAKKQQTGVDYTNLEKEFIGQLRTLLNQTVTA